MKKHSFGYLLFAFFLLSSMFLNAQQKVWFNEIVPIGTDAKYDFYIENVIDNRMDSVPKPEKYFGVEFEEINSIFENDLADLMLESITPYLPSDTNKKSLTLIIHKLTLLESKIRTPLGICFLEIELAIEEGASLLSLGIFESQHSSYLLNKTNGHANRISACLKTCIDNFSTTFWKTSERYEIDLSNNTFVFDYTTPPPDGAYLSFAQLARHRPLGSVQTELTSDQFRKFPKYMLKGTSREDVDNAVQDGIVYKRVGRAYGYSVYLKSKQFGRYIYFEMKVSDPLAMHYYGLIAYLVSKKGTGLALDTETGDFIVLRDPEIVLLTKDYPDIIKTYRASKRKLSDLEFLISQLNILWAAKN